jgi:hypothetical protein
VVVVEHLEPLVLLVQAEHLVHPVQAVVVEVVVHLEPLAHPVVVEQAELQVQAELLVERVVDYLL